MDNSQTMLGIGILEEDILHSSFLGQEEAVYLGAHKAVHCIVEITDDFCVQGDSLHRCRRRLGDLMQRQSDPIRIAQRVITRRIITEKSPVGSAGMIISGLISMCEKICN